MAVRLGAIWAVLLTAPFWMPLVGGYSALGTRVLVLGLAAMSVNFLLGFTGVLSFGHAAYFGLGAYGAGLTLKFVAASTPLALVAGTLLGGLAGAVLGALIVHRRGVYFAMVTIAFGQVFYYIAFQWSSLTGGDDGLRGFARQPLHLGFTTFDILNDATAFFYFVLLCFALATGAMALVLRSPFGRTMLAGTLLGGLAGTLFGLLIVRRRGVYFAMCTIAFGQLWYYLAYSWNGFTGGFDGLRDFHREPIAFGPFTLDITTDNTFYYFLLAIFAVAVAFLALLLRSPFGRTLLAIRENERRARFAGIPVEQHIWISFSISCFITALAGTLYALLNNFADPLTLHYSLSGYFVVMTVIGGMRSFWGPLIGSAIFLVLQDYISSHTENWMSFIGLFFVLVVLFFPRGLLGTRRRAAT